MASARRAVSGRLALFFTIGSPGSTAWGVGRQRSPINPPSPVSLNHEALYL